MRFCSVQDGVDPANLRISLSVSGVKRWLTGGIATLAAVSVGIHLWKYQLAGGQQRWYVIYFDLGAEHSIPTYYQVISLLAASLLLALIGRLPARKGRPAPRWWLLLSGTFCLLSIDELCQIHEQVGYLVEKSFHTHGFLRFGWVVAAIPFVAIFGAIYLRFLYQLPKRYAIRFIIAGAIYVGGAVGMEMVGGQYAEKHGEDNLTYNLLSDTEETAEMAGIGLFIVSLVSYLAQCQARTTLAFSRNAAGESTRVSDLSTSRQAA